MKYETADSFIVGPQLMSLKGVLTTIVVTEFVSRIVSK